VAALLASRMAFDAYGSTDMLALEIFSGALALAYLLGRRFGLLYNFSERIHSVG